MNKKGAVEFSITTIIIVIIGVTILALAIPWVTRTIGQTSDLTDAAFDQAKLALAGKLGPNNPVIVSPSTLRLGANKQASVSVGCYNGDSGDFSGDTKLDNTLPGSNTDVDKSANPSTDFNNPAGGSVYWGIVVGSKSPVPDKPDVLTLTVICSSQPKVVPLTIIYE